jgi:hypothetical protein
MKAKKMPYFANNDWCYGSTSITTCNSVTQWIQYDAGTNTTINWGNYYQTGNIDSWIPTPASTQLIYPQLAYTEWNSFTIGNYTEVSETEEQRHAREEAARKRKEEHAAAKKRAELLLTSILTDAQRETWEKEKFFEIVVAGKVYRLRERGNYAQRVQLVEAGKPLVEYCIHPSATHELPAPDVLLAQKLLLETNELEFLRIANATRLAA